MSTCPRCVFPVRVCLCAELPVVATRTHVVIVRHHTERFRSSNSGRLAHLVLSNSALVDHGVAGAPAALPPLDGAWLVFPEGNAPPALAPPPRQLVVLDATWSQARRMYRKLGALRGLPILRLPAGDVPPPARMRAAPSPDRVSTIEAIARALRLVEGDAVADPLEAAFQLAVARAAATGRSVATAGPPALR